MAVIKIIPAEEFARVRAADLDKFDKLPLLAAMCRANALAAVKRAGSGHLGSSFSAMDIVVWLYEQQMNTMQVGHESRRPRRVFFIERPRRSRTLRAASRAGNRAGRAPDEIASLRRPGRPSRREDSRHRSQFRLAGHGHFQRARHRLGEARSRGAAATFTS